MKNFLHLSHTDIRADSRILKEMRAIQAAKFSAKLSGIGILDKELSHYSCDNEDLDLTLISLVSSRWRFLPNSVRLGLSLIEFYFKLIVEVSSNKPDVIHCHDTMVLPAGFFIKLLCKSKLIYDAHELESKRNGITRIMSFLTLRVEKNIWRHIDGLIVVSPSIQHWYNENIGNIKSEIILNSPMIDNNKYNIESNYLHKKFSIDISKDIYIYIGGFVTGRSIENIVEAFKNNQVTSHVVFLGYGPLYDYLIDQSNLHENIHVHEAVEHEKVVSIAQTANVGVCFIENISLSDYYCLPNKLFEYAFARLPILASDFPDISELVSIYRLGKCSQSSVKSIVESILEFEEEKGLVKPELESLYPISWQAQESKLIDFYNKIMAS